MRQYRRSYDTCRYDGTELDPWIVTPDLHSQQTGCCLRKWQNVVLLGCLLFVVLFVVVLVLVVFLFQSSEQSENALDIEYIHYEAPTPLDLDEQEFGPFGVKMDSIPYNRHNPYQVKSKSQSVRISPTKESEVSLMQAVNRTPKRPPLRFNPTSVEMTTSSTTFITITTDANLSAENKPLVKSWFTTVESTEVSQTASISPAPELFEITTNAKVSNPPVDALFSAVKRDCSAHAEDENASGVYLVSPDSDESFLVYCDQETDGGGWTVIQRRTGPTVYFYNRTWHEYEEGFGDIKESHWLGLAKIHRLAPRSKDYWTLRIQLHGDTCSGIGCIKEKDGFWWAEWPFKLGDSSSMYVVELGPALRGNLTTPNSTDYLLENNGYPFTTIDRDNDAAGLNCAQFRNYGGWWHSNCGHVALNGIYGDTEPSRRYMVYTYSSSKARNKKYFIHPKKSIMMIRPNS